MQITPFGLPLPAAELGIDLIVFPTEAGNSCFLNISASELLTRNEIY